MQRNGAEERGQTQRMEVGLLRVHECRRRCACASEWLLDLDEAQDGVGIDELTAQCRRILKQSSRVRWQH